MLKYLLLLVLAGPTGLSAAAPAATPAWQEKVAATLPLLGHRNWILIVDSAYPLQVSPGIETIETNAGLIEVLRTVIADLDHSPHVSPIVSMDAELPFLTDQTAPGVSQYRSEIKQLFHNRPVQSVPHEQILKQVDETARTYRILVLKTKMTIPYTSVFLQLDCKYWKDDAEKQLRETMNATQK